MVAVGVERELRDEKETAADIGEAFIRFPFLITEDAENIAAMKAQYDELYTRLGNGSASRKAAEVVIRTAAR